MKTNLYTGVTLGFKNAMGCLSYNLRQRNHNHAIDQKLVDMLHLFKADLVIIDGIVGGEGNCPAPVEPVQSRVIISGNHSVETDRVAIRMMGFDPADDPLDAGLRMKMVSMTRRYRIIGDAEGNRLSPRRSILVG